MVKQWIFGKVSLAHPDEPLPPHPAFSMWEHYMGAITPAHGDYEHFVEETFRLYSAVTAFGAENLWVHAFNEHPGKAQNLVTSEWKTLEELLAEGAAAYGPIPDSRHSRQAKNPVDDYCTLEAFRKHSGRIVGLGGFADRDDESSSMESTLALIKQSGNNEALLKQRHAKLPLIRLDLGQWVPGDDVVSCADENAGWALINNEGRRNAYLIQEVIPMTYEYRFFIINGVPVTGAGCVSEFTPLQNTAPFDPQMKQHRKPESQVEVRADILEEYLLFAGTVAADIAAERPEFSRYVLDVALGRDNQPVVVELNGDSNAGFYACRPELVTKALKEI